MFNLLIAALAGIFACIEYWTDHTMVRSESKPVDTDIYWKLFTGGAAIAYATTLFVSQDTTTSVDAVTSSVKDTITEIVDTIKTGQPSF